MLHTLKIVYCKFVLRKSFTSPLFYWDFFLSLLHLLTACDCVCWFYYLGVKAVVDMDDAKLG